MYDHQAVSKGKCKGGERESGREECQRMHWLLHYRNSVLVTVIDSHRKVKPTGVSLDFELLIIVPLLSSTFCPEPVIDHKPVDPRYKILFRMHRSVQV